MVTAGRILIDLTTLEQHAAQLLGPRSKSAKLFDKLIATIRQESAQRRNRLNAEMDATNGTYTPDGASDYADYIRAHASERICDARAINRSR